MWGLLQLCTGALSDPLGRKRLIAGGVLVQSGALASVALAGILALGRCGGAARRGHGDGLPAWLSPRA